MKLIYILLFINLSNAWVFNNYKKMKLKNIKLKNKKVLITQNKTIESMNIILELLEPSKTDRLSLKRNKRHIWSIIPSIKKQTFKCIIWFMIILINIYIIYK